MSGDLKLAVRRLIASPLFVIFAVASLALGVGVTVTGYAVIESLFWRPLGVTSPERVAVVTVPARGSRAWRQRLSQLDFAELQTQQRVFSRVAAVTTFSSSLAGEGGLEFIRGEAVRPGFFDVIGHGNPIRGMKMADFARSIESYRPHYCRQDRSRRLLRVHAEVYGHAVAGQRCPLAVHRAAGATRSQAPSGNRAGARARYRYIERPTEN